jgi:hypothetical protein
VQERTNQLKTFILVNRYFVRDVAKRLEILSGMKINVLPHFQQEYLVHLKKYTTIYWWKYATKRRTSCK